MLAAAAPEALATTNAARGARGGGAWRWGGVRHKEVSVGCGACVRARVVSVVLTASASVLLVCVRRPQP